MTADTSLLLNCSEAEAVLWLYLYVFLLFLIVIICVFHCAIVTKSCSCTNTKFVQTKLHSIVLITWLHQRLAGIYDVPTIRTRHSVGRIPAQLTRKAFGYFTSPLPKHPRVQTRINSLPTFHMRELVDLECPNSQPSSTVIKWCICFVCMSVLSTLR